MGWGGMTPSPVAGVMLTYARDHYCKACWCSAKTHIGVPCWQCGAETSPTAPHGWISMTPSAVNVRAGNAFGIEDIADCQPGVASLPMP